MDGTLLCHGFVVKIRHARPFIDELLAMQGNSASMDAQGRGWYRFLMTLVTDQAALAELCRKYRIRRLSLFGSVLKGTARPDSDVDLLVEFHPGATPTLFGLATMEAEFSGLLGRKVDLRTPAELSRYFRDQVLSEAEVQYVAA